MVLVGDQGIVMNSFGDKIFVPLGSVEVGDTVAVYNLRDNTRIAVPMLTLDIGDMVFKTPSFDFAGFDWKLDFDFNLLPLDLSFAAIASMTWEDSNFKSSGVQWFSGTYPAGTYKIFFQGWWNAWGRGSEFAYDCVASQSNPKNFPLWCGNINLARNYGGEDIIYPTSYFVTEVHPDLKNSWGYLHIVMESPGKIGFWVYDSNYTDNIGEAQFNLFND